MCFLTDLNSDALSRKVTLSQESRPGSITPTLLARPMFQCPCEDSSHRQSSELICGWQGMLPHVQQLAAKAEEYWQQGKLSPGERAKLCDFMLTTVSVSSIELQQEVIESLSAFFSLHGFLDVVNVVSVPNDNKMGVHTPAPRLDANRSRAPCLSPIHVTSDLLGESQTTLS